MTTPRTRVAVAIGAAVIVALALGAPWLAGTGRADAPAALIFGPARRLGQDDRNPASPFLRQGPGGRLYAVWTEDDPRQPAEAKQPPATPRHRHPGMFTFAMRVARLASSGDVGATWSAPRQVNDGVEAVQGEENEAQLAFDAGGRAYVVWSTPSDEGDKTRANVRFAMENGQGGFTLARTLNEIKDTARFPTVARHPDGGLFVAWIDRRIDSPTPRVLYAMRIGAGGPDTSRAHKIGSDACECCRLGLAFADAGKTVYLAHRHVTPEQIRNHVLLKSTDGGATFGPPVVISDDGWQTGCPHSGPTLGLDRHGHLHVTWFTQGRAPADAGVYYSVSKDGGRTFAPRQLVHANTAPEILHTTLALGPDGTVYFAWDNLDAASKAQVFARSLAPDGTSWSAVQQISEAKDNARRPVVAISGRALHVAWTESEGERTSIVVRSASIAR
jgi:hypothetical protein